MVKRKHFVFVILLASAAACGGTSRGLEAYRADANKLLETRSAELARCYNAALKTDATLAGTVTVQFVVEKQTGAIKDVKVDPAKTTAPEVLDNCVLNTIAGLVLAPPDRNEGRATFVYEFGPPPAPAS
jgi:predicted membrane-bound mannosyltransferase